MSIAAKGVVLAEPGQVFHFLHRDGPFPRVWNAGVCEAVAVVVIYSVAENVTVCPSATIWSTLIRLVEQLSGVIWTS